MRTGDVAWRGGAVAADCSKNPALFWLLVVLQLAVGGIIFWRGVS